MNKNNGCLSRKEFETLVNLIEQKKLKKSFKLLSLRDSYGNTIAHELAQRNWKTNNKKILLLKNNLGTSVAIMLAYYSPKWATYDIEILKERFVNNNTVAHLLAKNNKKWATNSLEVLSWVNDEGKTVEDYLREANKIV